MKFEMILLMSFVTACGCAQLDSSSDFATRAAHMKQSGEEYARCITAQADKDAKNPAGADDIAAAAHGRCWTQWQAYRDATNESFLSSARTPQEAQLARDKADAHLRQAELEARRGVVDRIIERSLSNKSRPTSE